MSLENEIRDYLTKQLSIPSDKVKANARFKEDLGADSLDFAEIISELEDRYKMTFQDDAMRKINTFGDLVSYVELHRKKPE